MKGLTKEDFKSYLDLIENINYMEETLYEMETAVQRITQQVNDMPAGHKEPDKITNKIAEIIDMQNEINDELMKKLRKKRDIEKVITLLPEEDERLMRLRYFKEMTFEMVSVKMNYCYRHTIRKHGEILQKIEKLTRGGGISEREMGSSEGIRESV